jgi:hypothetical protein
VRRMGPLRYGMRLLDDMEVIMGRGILLWMLGIPLPIILFLAFFR